jgi:presenilin-like A22 family membrane protease
MQTGKVRRQEVSNSKLFAIITTALIAVLAVPVIIQHITHTGLIYHILVHIASVIIAVFLTAISIIAYRRNGGTRFLL